MSCCRCNCQGQETALRVRIDVYAILQEAVEAGVAYGWRRAHKHVDAPGEDAITREIAQAVLSEILDRFDFPPHSADAD